MGSRAAGSAARLGWRLRARARCSRAPPLVKISDSSWGKAGRVCVASSPRPHRAAGRTSCARWRWPPWPCRISRKPRHRQPRRVRHQDYQGCPIPALRTTSATSPRMSERKGCLDLIFQKSTIHKTKIPPGADRPCRRNAIKLGTTGCVCVIHQWIRAERSVR